MQLWLREGGWDGGERRKEGGREEGGRVGGRRKKEGRKEGGRKGKGEWDIRYSKLVAGEEWFRFSRELHV